MSAKFESPELNKDAFTCPNCEAFAAMQWHDVLAANQYQALKLAFCHRCKRHSVWMDGSKNYPVKMIFPESINAPMPNEESGEIGVGPRQLTEKTRNHA